MPAGMLPADRLRPVLRGDQRRTGSPGAPTRMVNRDDGAQSWFCAARSRCVPPACYPRSGLVARLRFRLVVPLG
jgi:hypothetical protein